MSHQMIEEFWQIKSSIAHEHDYDLESPVAHLQTRQRSAGRRVVELSALKRSADKDGPGTVYRSRQ